MGLSLKSDHHIKVTYPKAIISLDTHTISHIDLILLGIGAIIGTGLFILTGVGAAYACRSCSNPVLHLPGSFLHQSVHMVKAQLPLVINIFSF